MWSGSRGWLLRCIRKSHALPIQKQNAPMATCVRFFGGRDLKKFYKKVTITQSEGGFEINLDKRKLKTPLGTVLTVPNESLALLVAAEWDSQQDIIQRSAMHMTTMCNTCIDNPSGLGRDTIANGILEFLSTDTICYRVEEPLGMAALQQAEWDPVLEWVKQRYQVDLESTTGLGVPVVPEETKQVFRQHLDSYTTWALWGYHNAVECIKSVVLASAVIDRHIGVERAVYLSRLELEYQMAKWGTVEWHHDVELHDTSMRLAAATLFVHLNSGDTRVTFDKGASVL